jgi:diguanylate cyclase (GGDEF)-like protein
MIVAEKARKALALPHATSLSASVVTFSAGIATYSAERDKASSDLITRADQALYRAKQLGRNRTVAA